MSTTSTTQMCGYTDWMILDRYRIPGQRFLIFRATMQSIILSAGVRNIYNVITKNNDAIDLVFGDGNFSNIPSGPFRVYHRVSDNARYTIQPADMQGIQFTIPYVDAFGGAQF
jgi:hypothetical protein